MTNNRKGKLVRHTPKKLKVNDWLLSKHGYNITSQGGEDGVIEEIFNILDKHEDPKNRRCCVEFGAWDGKHLSNTWNLLKNKNWTGVLIEADDIRYEQLVREYADLTSSVTCLQRKVTLDGENSISSILSSRNHGEIDFISIDIDGADYHIWDGLTFDPKVVCIEFNPTIPNHIVYIQPRNLEVYQGSSLLALVELANDRGYELVSTTTFNAFFVKKEYYRLFNIADNSLDLMHDVPMATDFFQLYDGTIKIAGCKKLIWKKLPIREEELQVISPRDREFPFAPKSSFENHPLHVAKQMLLLTSSMNVKDILQLFQKALEPSSRREIFEIYVEQGKKCLSRSAAKDATKWLKAAIYLQEDTSCYVAQLLGEAYLRCREFTKAHYWLQQSLITSKDADVRKATHKSLAKLYEKTNQRDLLNDMLQLLRRGSSTSN